MIDTKKSTSRSYLISQYFPCVKVCQNIDLFRIMIIYNETSSGGGGGEFKKICSLVFCETFRTIYLYTNRSLLPLLGTLRVARVSLLGPNESSRCRELSALLINDVVRYVLLNAQFTGAPRERQRSCS